MENVNMNDELLRRGDHNDAKERFPHEEEFDVKDDGMLITFVE
jgi:hypothetical protein